MTRPERPGEDASVDEIARWMEADFWAAVAEGAESAGEDESE